MTKSNDSICVWQQLLLVIFLILLLVIIPNVVFSKTLTRSCKGAEMIQYVINGKKYTYTGSYRYNGKGSSKGAVPSPVKARERA